MPRPGRTRTELPPTAGLPARYADFIRRPEEPLEAGLRDRLGIPRPALTCSGTAALVLALRVLCRQSPGRTRVIIPAYTCPLVPMTAHFAPVEMVPCDLLPQSIDLDPEKLAALCDERTLAIVATHLGGRVTDVRSASDIARANGAALIEDAAQAMGAAHKRESVGLCGDIGFFSLAAGKGLTMFEGGVLFSRDSRLQAELEAAEREFSSGLFWNVRRVFELFGYAAMYRPDRLWHVYGKRLCADVARNDDAAAVGDVFSLADIPLHRPDRWRRRVAANGLPRLFPFLEQGRERAVKRSAALRESGLAVLDDRPGDSGVWPFLMVLTSGKKQRDSALRQLWRKGLGVSRLFARPLPGYDFLSPWLDMRAQYPAAQDLADRMLTITNSPWLEDRDFAFILDCLHKANKSS